MNKFVKAERKRAKLRLGISGPSGSGKTFSALRLAKGIGGKIAVIDTERGSASLYSERFEFDVMELLPPFTTEKYIEAMDAAAQAGYDILIIDSTSHAWNGEGGILDQKGKIDERGGNSFTNWAKFTPKQERFLSAITGSPIHVICTMRSKQDYILGENSSGKTIPKKVGLAPVQREGFEYELTTMFDVAMNHQAEASKDRTGLFVDKLFQITEKTGEELRDWLNGGSVPAKDVPKVEELEPKQDVTESVDATLPGEYVFTFGNNEGKRLKDIPEKSLRGWIDWASKQPNKQGHIKEAVLMVDMYLNQK